MGPNGRNSSLRSDSRVSSLIFETLIVASSPLRSLPNESDSPTAEAPSLFDGSTYLPGPPDFSGSSESAEREGPAGGSEFL